MKTSPQGISKLIRREGERLEAYLDTKGIPTIGVGHTGPEVHLGLKWTEKQVEQALAKDLQWAEDAVNSVTSPLTQNQFDALVSFVFNVGATAFNKSTMKRFLNESEYTKAAIQFDAWHIPPEIIGRRNSEKAQFLS